MLLTYHREPHLNLVERIHHHHMVHGAVAFYEVAELRTRSDQIIQTSGISKTTEDLAKVVQSDSKSTLSSWLWSNLNLCEFSQAAGPLKYLSELEDWCRENRGV